jgi:hypothetical protein
MCLEEEEEDARRRRKRETYYSILLLQHQMSFIESAKHNKTNLYTRFDDWGVMWKVEFGLEVKVKVSKLRTEGTASIENHHFWQRPLNGITMAQLHISRLDI